MEQRLTPQRGPQTQFLSNPADLILFGGSAGGGVYPPSFLIRG